MNRFLQSPGSSASADGLHLSSALNPTCHILIPNLLCADVFPQATAIVLHMLEMEGDEEELKGLKMNTEDLALPLLHQVGVFIK